MSIDVVYIVTMFVLIDKVMSVRSDEPLRKYSDSSAGRDSSMTVTLH